MACFPNFYTIFDSTSLLKFIHTVLNGKPVQRFEHYFRKRNQTHNYATRHADSRVTLYTAGHLHTAVPHCWHSRAPTVHTAVPRENNEHGCVYLRCRAVCKLPGCVEGHPWDSIAKDKCKTGYGKRKVHYLCATKWNDLENYIKNFEYSAFKKTITEQKIKN